MSKRRVKVKYLNSVHEILVDKYPSQCGVCHANIDPTFISGAFVRPTNARQDELELVFQCTNVKCNRLIIGYFIRDGGVGLYIYEKQEPNRPKEELFQEEVREVSGNFIQIYNQAFHAEQTKLNLISGIGYRKAIEFLIKDYLIYCAPDDEKIILKKPLGQCIDMLDNHNIKEIAKRATWIGNDEAHYMRKWEDKDINDLKKLIEVTVYFIAMDVSAKKYLEEMK